MKSARAYWFLIVLGVSCNLVAAQQPTFVVRGPTVIAFFPPLTPQDVKGGGDETLSDFQYYSGKARASLREAGIDFQEAYARSFRVQRGNTRTIFRFPKDRYGYYLIAPGKKPQIEYGMVTNLEAVAAEYFGVAVK